MSNLVTKLDEAIEQLTALKDHIQAQQEAMKKELAALRKPIPAIKLPLDQAIQSFFQSLAGK